MLSDFKQRIFDIFSLIVLCILVPIGLWILFFIIFAPSISNESKICATKIDKKIISQFKSGDLLFFSGTHILERSIRTMQWSPFSHTCLVVLDKKNTPYIIEVDNHPKKNINRSTYNSFNKQIVIIKK